MKSFNGIKLHNFYIFSNGTNSVSFEDEEGELFNYPISLFMQESEYFEDGESSETLKSLAVTSMAFQEPKRFEVFKKSLVFAHHGEFWSEYTRKSHSFHTEKRREINGRTKIDH